MDEIIKYLPPFGLVPIRAQVLFLEPQEVLYSRVNYYSPQDQGIVNIYEITKPTRGCSSSFGCSLILLEILILTFAFVTFGIINIRHPKSLKIPTIKKYELSFTACF